MLSTSHCLEEYGLMELPVEFMNQDHAHAGEQCRVLIATLEDGPEHADRLLRVFEDFIRHSQEHFQREEAAMRASGFPPYPVHKQEHDRVLAWLESLLDALRDGAGGPELGNAIRRELPEWLRQHVSSMDLVTARWIAARG